MIHTVIEDKNSNFTWLDVINPSNEEFAQLSSALQIPIYLLESSLRPENLPKHDFFEKFDFIILRAHDENAAEDADTVRELTNKVIFFVAPHFLLTVHRGDYSFMKSLREKWIVTFSQSNCGHNEVLWDIFKIVIDTFEDPIQKSFTLLEDFEKRIFHNQITTEIVQDLYLLKRNASVYKRILFLSNELLTHFEATPESSKWIIDDLRDDTERLAFLSDQLQDSVTNLLHLHLSLSSNRTNEVMRVLTIFSVFFLPLTFIVGIYGMNFKYMPELESYAGYPLVWVAMIVITIVIFIWFKRKGWLNFK